MNSMECRLLACNQYLARHKPMCRAWSVHRLVQVNARLTLLSAHRYPALYEWEQVTLDTSRGKVSIVSHWAQRVKLSEPYVTVKDILNISILRLLTDCSLWIQTVSGKQLLSRCILMEILSKNLFRLYTNLKTKKTYIGVFQLSSSINLSIRIFYCIFARCHEIVSKHYIQ